MEFRINLLFLACFITLTLAGFAQEGITEPVDLVADANKTAVPPFPYIAEITDDDVCVRSGPGTNYYYCSKLNKGDKVKVVDNKLIWSCIVPPSESFCWISKQYVSVDPNNLAVGIVVTNNVHVYAGAEHLKPIHSETTLSRLNSGDKVSLLGEEKEEYCRIVPPSDAYLWVSTESTKPLGSVDEIPMVIEHAQADAAVVAPAESPIVNESLEKYYALKEQIEAELVKPITKQNFTEIKNALTEIAANKMLGNAARYSEFAIKKIETYELAAEVSKAVKLQDKHLQQIYERIDKALTARRAQLPDLGKFAVIGRVKASKIYSPKAKRRHYQITDDAGIIICYALSEDSVAETKINKLVDQKVGLIGTIEPHPQTEGALVRFTDIVKLK